jgi:hypothetical protein
LKGDHPRTIPAKFALIWFSGFRGEDLNVIFYQNMPNLHNTKPGRDSPWVVPFQYCVRQLHPPFKMAADTKNRNFFNCPLLLYYKRGKDLNVIFYQNMPNLHNRYKSAEKKIHRKTQNIC